MSYTHENFMEYMDDPFTNSNYKFKYWILILQLEKIKFW